MPSMLRIAIVGAGFSGLATAIQLARQAKEHHIDLTIFDDSKPFGGGLAYGPLAKNFLLNVPAQKMSLFADKPNDFLDFCQSQGYAVDPAEFVQRERFGAYLRDRLDFYIKNNDNIHIHFLPERVVKIEYFLHHNEWQLTTRAGIQIDFDQIIIATGYQKPLWPIDLQHIGSDQAIDAWDFESIDKLPNARTICFIGSGLTAIDTLIYLSEKNTDYNFIVLSRRGLLPHVHQTRNTAIGSSAIDEMLQYDDARLSKSMRRLRCIIQRHIEKGYDWRDVLDDLRPHLPALWQSLADDQKAVFLKRLNTFWDVHRHRMSQSVADRIDKLKRSGRLKLIAGRFISITKDQSGLFIEYNDTKTGHHTAFQAAAIINCSGHPTNVETSDNPLLLDLLTAGFLKPDATGLGIEIGPHYQVITRENKINNGLWYIGPMLKSKYWEATAVPELRLHAQALAAFILEHSAARPRDTTQHLSSG
jgi:uncharacterized NAD(P)/FAD-binding protein YdhS